MGSSARITSPVVPSMEMASLGPTTLPLTFISCFAASTLIDSQPTTEGLPIWRPTTAAWLVMPPAAVRTPTPAAIPWMSSGLVSWRTRITCSPFWERATASSAVKAMRPQAAPGEAARPLASTWCFARATGSKTGWRSWRSCTGSTRITASSRAMRPSSTMSVAIFTAAIPVRFPVRVWSM